MSIHMLFVFWFWITGQILDHSGTRKSHPNPYQKKWTIPSTGSGIFGTGSKYSAGITIVLFPFSISPILNFETIFNNKARIIKHWFVETMFQERFKFGCCVNWACVYAIWPVWLNRWWQCQRIIYLKNFKISIFSYWLGYFGHVPRERGRERNMLKP